MKVSKIQGSIEFLGREVEFESAPTALTLKDVNTADQKILLEVLMRFSEAMKAKKDDTCEK